MKILIASDHAGFELKEFIKDYFKDTFSFVDYGTTSLESVDYTDFAHPLADAVSKNSIQQAILICGTGNGMAMTANKHSNVRAALCWNKNIAELAIQHNNANVLVLPARFISNEEAVLIVNSFFSSHFEGGRHQRRIDKINIK